MAKTQPETLAIRARPQPVTRLSRKALAGLLGVAALAVLGGTIWALKPPAKPTSPDELYSTDRKATAEGLNTLPKDYSALGADNAGVPKLGPPLPGDLGRPILKAQQDGQLGAEGTPPIGAAGSPGATAADQAREQQVKSAQDAIDSPLFSVSDTRGAASAIAGAGAGDVGALVQA